MKDVTDKLIDTGRFLSFVVRRFLADRCPNQAASLSYTMLLSLVPMTAVTLAMFAAFPAFDRLTGELVDLALDSFLPDGAGGLENQIRDHLLSFLENTGNLPAAGTLMLGVTAILLLGTIEETMNSIWRIRKPRPPLARLVVFWSLLTVGPLLLGAALSMSSYLFVLRELAGEAGVEEEFIARFSRLEMIVPFLLSTLAFTLLYIGMPNRPVRWRDGLFGGLATAAGMEILKKGFGWAVTSMASYETIYGAVATVPIFLIWMYLVWMVILFGAEMSAARAEWRAARLAGIEARAAAWEIGNDRRLVVALSVLSRLAESFRDPGLPPRLSQLQRELMIGPQEMDWVISKLAEHGYIQTTEGKRVVLGRDLALVSLAAFMDQIGVVLGKGDPGELSGRPWGAVLDGLLDRMAHDIHATAELSLSDLFDQGSSAEVVALQSRTE